MTTEVQFIEHYCRAEPRQKIFVRAGTRCPYCPEFISARAPWSYQQLIGWIGIEAMYQIDKLALIAQNHTIVTREQWAVLTRVLVFTHEQFIQLLQAGIVPKRELGLGAELPAGGNRNGGGLHLGRDHRFRNAT